jgi:hypothetical protein
VPWPYSSWSHGFSSPIKVRPVFMLSRNASRFLCSFLVEYARPLSRTAILIFGETVLYLLSGPSSSVCVCCWRSVNQSSARDALPSISFVTLEHTRLDLRFGPWTRDIKGETIESRRGCSHMWRTLIFHVRSVISQKPCVLERIVLS